MAGEFFAVPLFNKKVLTKLLTLSNAGGEEEKDGNADTHEAAGITENGRGSIGVEEECKRDK